MSLEEYCLGTVHLDRVVTDSSRGGYFSFSHALKVKFNSLFDHRYRLIWRRSAAGNIEVHALGCELVSVTQYDDFYIDGLSS